MSRFYVFHNTKKRNAAKVWQNSVFSRTLVILFRFCVVFCFFVTGAVSALHFPVQHQTHHGTQRKGGGQRPDEFMAEIEAQVRQLVKTYSCISADKQNLFQSERVIIGKCPRCGENVYEGKKNFYCGNRGCQFVMWKNDRFFEQRKKAFTPKIAAALLKNGKAKVKGLYSEKTGKTYDATVLLADTGGKYVNYRVERKE